MILDAISTIAITVVTWIVNLAPTMTSNDYATLSTISNTINSFFNLIYWASFFFPIAHAWTIILNLTFLSISYFTFRLIKWIASIVTIGIVK
jgi:hypothetical protein